jgi:uncharacterized membrane protein
VAPLIVMLAGWVVFRAIGPVAGPESAATWTGALRFAFALMFAFTAATHFVTRTRADLVRMVPPWLPQPALLVTVTGVLEVLGAVGLLVPSLARVAALALMALLIAMFPANVHAARTQQTIAGRPATPLVVRLPLQLFWIAGLGWIADRGR